jgi:hypothetical protein
MDLEEYRLTLLEAGIEYSDFRSLVRQFFAKNVPFDPSAVPTAKPVGKLLGLPTRARPASNTSSKLFFAPAGNDVVLPPGGSPQAAPFVVLLTVGSLAALGHFAPRGVCPARPEAFYDRS